MFGDSQGNPKGFPYKRINEFAKCIAGATPSTKKKEYWSNGIIPWMSSGEVNYKRIWKTEKRISQVGYDSCSTKIIPAHTVVIAMAGQGRTRGTVAVAEIPLCTNQSLCSIITDETVDTDYLFTYLQFQYNNLRNISNGSSGRGGLNIKLIGQFTVLVPPLAIQQKFSNFLKEIDKSRFLEMFGMSEGIDKHLEDVADICSGITKGRKVLGLELREVPYMAVSNVKMGYIDLSTVKTIMATKNEIEQYRLFPNDILMTEGGDPDKVGRGAIIRNPPKDCIHQNHIFRVRLHKDVLLPEFFEEYLQGNSARRYFLKAAKQTTGIASINMKQLRALPVKIPPIKVQIQYSDFVHQVDKSKYGGTIFLRLLEDIRICCNI